MAELLKQTTHVKVEAWANVPPGVDPKVFAGHLIGLGNKVLDYDAKNNRWRLEFGENTNG